MRFLPTRASDTALGPCLGGSIRVKHLDRAITSSANLGRGFDLRLVVLGQEHAASGDALRAETLSRGTARNFLSYLGTHHPEVKRLDQLRREPHILGWMSRLRSQTPPLVTASYFNQLIALRPVLNELAWTEQLAELAHLIRREDIPRLPQKLPRPLTQEQDELLQQEFLLRNDLGGNVFLLIRHTGMRIGECADLSCDCLRSTGDRKSVV